MPEEVEKKDSKFYAVCAFCFHHEHNATLEINFRDNCIYYVCTSCSKINKMLLKPQGAPLPRTKIV